MASGSRRSSSSLQRFRQGLRLPGKLSSTQTVSPFCIDDVPTVMNFATDGVPLELRMNNMYGPGGHTLPLAGIVTLRMLPLVLS